MLSSNELHVLSYAVASRLPPKATGTVVIANVPAVESHLLSVEAYRKFRAFDKLATLSEETVADLLAKEREAQVFEQTLELPRASVFLSEGDQRAIFRDRGGWESFYKTYPESGGIFYLSRVGFSSDGTQALVHVGRQWMGRAGGGELLLVAVRDGNAAELGALSTWKS
ncbi:MAG: hypothetical protein ABJD97_02825 [Betaproteobacteria bacterium]